MATNETVIVTQTTYLERSGLRVEVTDNPGKGTMAPFPVLRIGTISIHPDRELLREVRDKIDAYLAGIGPGTVRPWEENT